LELPWDPLELPWDPLELPGAAALLFLELPFMLVELFGLPGIGRLSSASVLVSSAICATGECQVSRMDACLSAEIDTFFEIPTSVSLPCREAAPKDSDCRADLLLVVSDSALIRKLLPG